MVGLVRVFSKGRERSGEIVTRWIRRGNTKGRARTVTRGVLHWRVDIFCLTVPRRRDFYCVNATSRAVAFSSHSGTESMRHLVRRPVATRFSNHSHSMDDSLDLWETYHRKRCWSTARIDIRWKLSVAVQVRVLGREFAEETNAVSDEIPFRLAAVSRVVLCGREKRTSPAERGIPWNCKPACFWNRCYWCVAAPINTLFRKISAFPPSPHPPRPGCG